VIEAQGVRRRHELLVPQRWGLSAAHLTHGEMHDPGSVAPIFQLEEEPTTPNLGIIRMCANG
jgi:hypothetical protein